jgi:uncharacterized protein (TIGR02266 family)
MSETTVSRDSQRVPLETRVQLKFEWFGGFISEYSANISPGGIFIRTQTPEPVGRLIGFELRLGDDYELIRGNGEVVWARAIDQGPDKPAGMGIRFLEITPDGRELIYQMVDNYIAQGGTPFDVTEMPGAVPAAKSDSAPPAVLRAEGETGENAPAELQATPPATPPGLPTGIPSTPGTAEWPRRLVDPTADWPASALPSDRMSTTSPMPPMPPMSPMPPTSPGLAGAGVAEEASPRRSRLLLWVTLAGALVLVTALAILKQDLLLGWFLPGRAQRTASTAGPAAPPLRRQVPTPAPVSPAPGSLAPVAPAAAPAVPAAPAASPAAAAASPGPGSNPASPVTTASPPPPPQPVEALPSAAASGPGEIQKITWKQEPDGTEVILWADSAIRRQDWAPYPIDGDPPRELVKLYGIRHPFPSARLVAGTRQLLQVRTGYHVGPKGNELHVVLDLTGFGVEVTGIEAQGEQLHVHLKGK